MYPASIVLVLIAVILIFKYGLPLFLKLWKKADMEEKKLNIEAEGEMAKEVGKIDRREVQKNRSKVKQFMNEN